MKKKLVVCTLGTALLSMPSLIAQSPASNKAFYSSGSMSDITFLTVGATGTSPEKVLFNLPAVLKTSSNGAMSAILSMEAVLMTYNRTTLTLDSTGKGSGTSSSRAALKVWVEADGREMHPGRVVFADRLQATGLTLELTCQVPGTTCSVGGTAILDLFQNTKNANSFTYFLGNLGSEIHSVVVKAQAVIECSVNGVPQTTCPTGTVKEFTDAKTQVAIGTASLLLEEQQNWAESAPRPPSN